MTAGKKNSLPLKAARRGAGAAMAIAGLWLLAACSGTQQVLSEITGSAPPAARATPAPARSPSAAAEAATPMGRQMLGLRAELQRLDDNVARHQAELERVRQSLGADRAAYAKLAGGLAAAPAGPRRDAALVEDYGQAQGRLDRINDDVAALNALSAETAGDIALAARLLDDIKAAAALPDAGEADRRQLQLLQDRVNADLPVVQRMADSVAAEIAQQNDYIDGERRRLAALDLAGTGGQPPPAVLAAAPRISSIDDQPLVTIRFDRPNVSYGHTLYLAVSSALDRKPDVRFKLVAVSPAAGSAAQVAVNADEAKRNAGSVMRSLVAMGLPADRIAISATTSADVTAGEVRIYVE